jgi:membrane-bound lytic murein transglycosylase B
MKFILPAEAVGTHRRHRLRGKFLLETAGGLLIGLLLSMAASADYSAHPAAQEVVDTLVEQHGFTRAEVLAVLAQANVEPAILKSMANAAEKTKTWTAYRDGFLNPLRIRKGAEFLKQYSSYLDQIEERYGVPREIIAAILGVETNFGGYTGNAKVLDALATLAFDHPSRGRFFRSELVEFIVLSRERGWAPAEQKGSYAGAMGWSQFMPSNYRRLAVDGDGDGHIDLHDPEDAMASIANYFVHHGWQREAPVASRAAVRHDFDVAAINESLQPLATVAALNDAGFFPQDNVEPERPATVVRFNDADGDEFWLGYQNFYVISRYNPRAKYAMAVYQLSQSIARAYRQQQSRSQTAALQRAVTTLGEATE